MSFHIHGKGKRPKRTHSSKINSKDTQEIERPKSTPKKGRPFQPQQAISHKERES